MVTCRHVGMRSIDALERFEEAARRYLPNPLRLLFIAEAPPAFKVNRLFYFTGLRDGDTLFLEMMKVLYPAEAGYSEGGFRPGSSVATTSPERSRTSAAARRTRRRLGVFDLLLSVMLVAHSTSVSRGRVNCHHPSGLITRVIQLGAKCFGPSVAFAVQSSVLLPPLRERAGAGDEGELSGTDDGLLPAADPELRVDVAGMRFDRVERYVQLVADLP